jgi:threonine dehydrogenase-like Zn-dependent dehydrogenase
MEPPNPEEGQVLVRIECLSICGSDLRIYDRVYQEEEYPLTTGRPAHECAGIVEESRSDDYTPGQRVIVLPSTSAGLVEYLVESPNRIIPLPEQGDLSTLLMCQPVGTVMYACQRMGSVLGKKVAILGQGPIGLSFTEMMARGGANQVIAIDLLDYRLDISKRVGGTHALNPIRDDIPNAIADITHGEMVDVVIEAAGRPTTSNLIWDIIRNQGLAILFGLPHDQVSFPFNYERMMYKLPTIIATIGARSGNPSKHIKECVNLVSQGRLDLSYLVTHRMRFDEVQQAYDIYSGKLDNVIKVVMEI